LSTLDTQDDRAGSARSDRGSGGDRGAPSDRALRAAIALAVAAHLSLPDAAQPGWLPYDVLMAAGAALVAWRDARTGWALIILGALGPLLTLRDHLTQSALLVAFATVGLITARRAGAAASRRLAIARLGAATYALAALHKLNDDFVAPATSCALHGLDQVVDLWGLPALPSQLAWLVPHAVLGTELAIALLMWTGRRWVAWPLAVAFHIPLTVTMAPAFAFVMLPSHAALATSRDLERLAHTLRAHAAGLAAATALATAASWFAHGAPPDDPTMWLKEPLVWGALALVLTACWRRGGLWGTAHDLAAAPRLLAHLACALWLLHGLTPYLGVQYQHAGAMLSNLRVDEGCWNHAFIPEAVRLRDDYVRVDRAHIATPGSIPDYEAKITGRLWSPPQLLQMRRNWCAPRTRPILLEGTWRARPFLIEDLCDPGEPWPFEGAGVLGVGGDVFPDALLFQKNLERACPQACIH
jgi:hypothetical protein